MPQLQEIKHYSASWYCQHSYTAISEFSRVCLGECQGQQECVISIDLYHSITLLTHQVEAKQGHIQEMQLCFYKKDGWKTFELHMLFVDKDSSGMCAEVCSLF